METGENKTLSALLKANALLLGTLLGFFTAAGAAWYYHGKTEGIFKAAEQAKIEYLSKIPKPYLDFVVLSEQTTTELESQAASARQAKFFFVGASATLGVLSFAAFLAFLVEKVFSWRRPPIPAEPRDIAALKRLESNASISIGVASTLLNERGESSAQLAQRIFDRAGVFLITGIVIALTGILLFIALISYLPKPQATGGTIPGAAVFAYFIELSPRLSALLFIEIIALFLLRQYRAAMDEFRHFEAIKRYREETQVLLAILAGESPTEIAKQLQVYSSAGKLGSGETTDLLESRKLNPDDAALINALGSFAQAIRGK